MSAHHVRLLWLADSLGHNSNPIIPWTLISTELCVCVCVHVPSASCSKGNNDLRAAASLSLTGTILFTSIPRRLAPFSPQRPDLASLSSPQSPTQSLTLITKHLTALKIYVIWRGQGLWYSPQLTWGLVTKTLTTAGWSPRANSANKTWLPRIH